MSETLNFLTIDEFLGALFHLNRHFRRNSHGTHNDKSKTTLVMVFGQRPSLICSAHSEITLGWFYVFITAVALPLSHRP
jgi:hypothetical protein